MTGDDGDDDDDDNGLVVVKWRLWVRETTDLSITIAATTTYK